MRRVVMALVLTAFATAAAAAADGWQESYRKGVEAIERKEWAEARTHLAKAITARPAEELNVRMRGGTVHYLPHFRLGVALFHLGEIDAAISEWETSQRAGVVQKTSHFAELRGWISKAESERASRAAVPAEERRKAAERLLNEALSLQASAIAGQADRADSFRLGQRKLQDAWQEFNRAGTSAAGYERAAVTAGEAKKAFAAAIEETKQRKARPLFRPEKSGGTAEPAPAVAEPAEEPPAQPAAAVSEPQPAPPREVESKAAMEARVAVQQLRARFIRTRSGVSDRHFQRFVDRALADLAELHAAIERSPSAETIERTAATTGSLELALEREWSAALEREKGEKRAVAVEGGVGEAFRAFSLGHHEESEAMLSALIDRRPRAATAWLLRGCIRHARAILGRRPELLELARSDFAEALRLDPRARLDGRRFSPKVIAFFEQVRGEKTR